MANLARKPPQNLNEFMSKAEQYINQEETLQALLGPKQTHNSAFEPRQKKKGFPEGQSGGRGLQIQARLKVAQRLQLDHLTP
jgi:hypothetical protein